MASVCTHPVYSIRNYLNGIHFAGIKACTPGTYVSSRRIGESAPGDHTECSSFPPDLRSDIISCMHAFNNCEDLFLWAAASQLVGVAYNLRPGRLHCT